MKKLFLLSVASYAVIIVSAQSNFDTASQPPVTVITYQSKNLFAEQNTVTGATNTSFQAAPAKKGILVMPAKGTNNIKIVFNADKAADAFITVRDEEGKKVLSQTASLAIGNNNIIIDNFTSLKEGTYTIDMGSNNETYTTTFLVWK